MGLAAVLVKTKKGSRIKECPSMGDMLYTMQTRKYAPAERLTGGKEEKSEILNFDILNNVQVRLVYLVFSVYLVRLLWRLERPDGQRDEIDRFGIVRVPGICIIKTQPT